MCVRIFTACWLVCLCTLTQSSSTALGQFGGVAEEAPVKLDTQQTQRWQVGLTVKAVGGPCAGLYGTIPVPAEWPEQSVKIVDEHVTRNVRSIKYRNLPGGVRQMLFMIPRVNAGDTAEALITFEVTKSSLLPPTDTSAYKIPRRIPRDVRISLGASPYIETRYPKFRSVVRDITKDKEGAWNQVEAIYDWVRDNVEYDNDKLKGAVATLRDKKGDKEDLTNLFIALCRVHKVPARTVWVPDHCYAEFYLEGEDGEGVWFPCRVAGNRDFGGISDHRIVLQKGDNISVPEKKEAQRFVAELLKGKSIPGGGKPQVTFIRKTMAAN